MNVPDAHEIVVVDLATGVTAIASDARRGIQFSDSDRAGGNLGVPVRRRQRDAPRLGGSACRLIALMRVFSVSGSSAGAPSDSDASQQLRS